MSPTERARLAHHVNFSSRTLSFRQSVRTAIPDFRALRFADRTDSSLRSGSSRRFSADRSLVVVRVDLIFLLCDFCCDLLDRSLNVFLNLVPNITASQHRSSEDTSTRTNPSEM